MMRLVPPWILHGAVQVTGALLIAAASPAYAQQPAPGTPSPAASAPAAQPLPKDLPLRRDVPGSSDAPPWAALLGLLVIAGAAGVIVLRRRGTAGFFQTLQGQGGRGGIERLASQPLTAQASVHAVRWQGEELLVACTATQVTLLSRRSPPAAGSEGS